MRLIIHVSLLCDTPSRHVYAQLQKEFDTNLVPMVGMEIEDPVWKKCRPIKSVTINPTDGYYYVYAGEDAGRDQDHCKRLEQRYHADGWKRPGG